MKFNQQQLSCWLPLTEHCRHIPGVPSNISAVIWDHGAGDDMKGRGRKAAPRSAFQGFFRVGSHLLFHSWLFSGWEGPPGAEHEEHKATAP